MHMVIILGDYAVQEISMALKYIAKVDILNIFLARAGSLLSLSFQDTRDSIWLAITLHSGIGSRVFLSSDVN